MVRLKLILRTKVTRRVKVLIAVSVFMLGALIVAVFADEDASYLNFYQKPIYSFTLIQILAFTLISQQQYVCDRKNVGSKAIGKGLNPQT